VNEPQINVDHFYHRPIYHVVGLLTENSEIPAISGELEAAGVDVTAVKILCGEQGARILDEHGRCHGLRGRIVRTVAASPSLTSVAILAAIVFIRTFLSFSLEVETTGRWPWQKRDISAS
jgi:Protein of unknown function (DUF1622)